VLCIRIPGQVTRNSTYGVHVNKTSGTGDDSVLGYRLATRGSTVRAVHTMSLLIATAVHITTRGSTVRAEHTVSLLIATAVHITTRGSTVRAEHTVPLLIATAVPITRCL
jgi:hypothetical protein